MATTYKDYNSSRLSKSKLLIRKEIDEIDELDAIWVENYNQFQALTRDKTEPEVNSILQQKNLDRPETAAHFCTALLYAILTEENSSMYLRYLSHIVRDGFAFGVSQLKRLINEKYTKMLEPCQKKLLWLVSEFVKLNVRETDILCCNLLRQIPSGDISQSSIWLAEQMLSLLTEHKVWLYMSSELIPYAVYTFTRIISDHSAPALASLKEREVRFCVEVIREKFAECRVIGRDFVRLLQDLTKIPLFTDLWKDILQRPQSLSSQFTDLSQLFAIRTPRKFLQSRVTPDMEKLLLFIMQKVTMGNQKRYQQWFAQNYLMSVENESLIVDLIRFICCVYHPSNVILSSDIVPRWAVIGWLLNIIKNSTVQANAKLALFYDWFYFNPQVDNIMNIEPGMLLMIHSIPKYASFTAQLLEFIIFVMEMYYPAGCDIIQKGVRNSLQIMLEKGVIPSIEPLVTFPGLDEQVRQKVVHCFAPFIPGLNRPPPESKPQPPPQQMPKLEAENKKPREPTPRQNANAPSPMDVDQKPDHVMEDVETTTNKHPHNISDTPFSEQASKLQSLVREKTLSPALQEAWISFIDSYCTTVKENEQEKASLSKIVANFLLSELEDCFICFGTKQHLPRISNGVNSKTPSREQLLLIDDLHKRMFTDGEEKPNFAIRELLLQLRIIEPRVGYHFLIYITGRIQAQQKQLLDTDKLSHRNKLKKLKKTTRKENTSALHSLLNSISELDCPMDLSHSTIYKSYLSCINKRKQSFVMDCKLCAETDPESFFWMLPQLCTYISFTHSSDFVNTVVSHIDPPQFSILLGALMKGSYQLLGTNTQSILSHSLHWGSYEQSLLWQIVKAECSLDDIKTFIGPLLRDIKAPDKHGEALGGIIILLKEIVHSTIIETIVTLPEPFKLLPTDLLSYWFVLDSKETISAVSDLTDRLCEPDTRDAEKAKNLLLQLTVWVFRSSHDTIKKLPPSFVKQINNLITEFDDDNTYSNLLAIISNKQKS